MRSVQYLLFSVALIVTAALVTGCGGNASPKPTTTATPAPTPSTPNPTPTSTPTPAPPSTPAPPTTPPPPSPPPSGGSGGSGGGSSSAAYTIQDIGNPGGGESLNDNDQVTGTGQHAWIWNNGHVTDLGTLAGSGTSWGLQINNAGQVAGFSTASDGQWHAILYSGGKMNDLGLPPGGIYSEAWGLNNNAQVVGFSETTNSRVAFVYASGNMQVLPTLGGTYGPNSGAEARGINDSGVIVGDAAVGMAEHAVMWINGTIQDLGVPPANAVATRINSSNQIVGDFFQNSTSHAFLWSGGTYKDLGTLPGRNSTSAWGINNAGVVVGSSYVEGQPPTNSAAYIYQNGQMQDLNTMIPANSGWALSVAFDINNKGQILVGGTLNGQSHYAILTPTK